MTTTREMWESDEWQVRRAKSRSYQSQYKGRYLTETEPHRDGKGKLVKTFPYELNISALVCDVHKDYARGELRNDELFVKTVVVRGDEPEQADLAEEVINNKIWRPSFGGFILQQALLSMNIYGGTVFKISFEPWDPDLPLGLAVRHIPDPAFIKPEWDFLNPWRMIECWFGYEISPEMSRIKYNVEPKSTTKPPLYMEHWTKEEWRITIDDVVPSMEGYGPLEGENPWGFVPFYYIPHDVGGTDKWGRSQLNGLEELSKDINSRTVGVTDMVRGIRHGVMWATEMRGVPTIKDARPKGQAPIEIIDIGTSSGAAGAKSPQLHSMPSIDVPEYYAKWPETLLDIVMTFVRISPATFGKDDTGSGRITGPAVAQRMWTSTSHASTERLNLTTAKSLLDGDLIKIMSSPRFKADLSKFDLEDPKIEKIKHVIMQAWPTYLPLDRAEQHRELIERLRDGGISPEKYLEEMGVVDVDQERSRILKWKEDFTGAVKKLFGGGNNGGGAQFENTEAGPGAGGGRRVPEERLGQGDPGGNTRSDQ